MSNGGHICGYNFVGCEANFFDTSKLNVSKLVYAHNQTHPAKIVADILLSASFRCLQPVCMLISHKNLLHDLFTATIFGQITTFYREWQKLQTPHKFQKWDQRTTFLFFSRKEFVSRILNDEVTSHLVKAALPSSARL